MPAQGVVDTRARRVLGVKEVGLAVDMEGDLELLLLSEESSVPHEGLAVDAAALVLEQRNAFND